VTDIATTSTALATQDFDDYDGLADFDESDIVMPVIKIDHQEAVYVDSLSGVKSTELDAVVLGLVKQRVLWHHVVEDDAKPLCQSLNHEQGRPGKDFPWKDSGFAKDASLAEGEQQIVNCADCPLKEWGSHPSNDTPYCSETHTYVLGLPTPDGQSFSPATLTVKGSALKGSKAYLSSFVRERTPTFVVMTKLGLEARKRGTVHYAVPTFVRGAAVAREFFDDFKRQFRTTRDFLWTPRSAEAEAEGIASTGAAVSPNVPVVSDDDLPF
jgi:hypothetical protein